MREFKLIKELYNELRAERSKYTSQWEKISKYAGIKVPDQWADTETHNNTEDKTLDKYTYDPTASLAVQQSAEYVKGIMWGDGKGVLSLIPTSDVLNNADKNAVDKWYNWASEIVLDEMNTTDGGLDTALSAYFYDQKAFGTAGIGAYWSNDGLLFRHYGVDKSCIDEGGNGLIDTVFTAYNWRVNRIVNEFCRENGEISEVLLNTLPDEIVKRWKCGKVNDMFNIIHGVLPNEDYRRDAQAGIKSCKCIGYWFCDDHCEKPIKIDYYSYMPIAMCREEHIRGELYGRSSGTILLSSIKCINEAMQDTMETLDKMIEPPIGVYSNSLFGDGAINTSAGSLTVFNSEQMAGNNPIIKMQDVGDPSGMIQWLIPYLTEKVTTAFKIDVLLDFASKSNMTATEALQRYTIRSHALAGLIVRHKNEMLVPLIKRCVSLLLKNGKLGYEEGTQEAEIAVQMNKPYMVIPSAVVNAINSNKDWFKIQFNNQIDKITRTETLDDLNKALMIIGALAQSNPNILQAVEWYKLLAKATNSLGFDDLIISENDYNQILQNQAMQQAQMQQAQMQQLQAQTDNLNMETLSDE